MGEDAGWFLDHFTHRELAGYLAGGRTRLLLQLWFAALASLAVCIGALWFAAERVRSLEADPGALAVVAIVTGGFALAVFCFHVVRLRESRRLLRGEVSLAVIAAWLEPEPRDRSARRRSRRIPELGCLSMHASEVAEILLVRAVEESLPDQAVSPAAAAADAAASGEDAEGEAAWIARRAAYRLDHDLSRLPPARASRGRAACTRRAAAAAVRSRRARQLARAPPPRSTCSTTRSRSWWRGTSGSTRCSSRGRCSGARKAARSRTACVAAAPAGRERSSAANTGAVGARRGAARRAACAAGCSAARFPRSGCGCAAARATSRRDASRSGAVARRFWSLWLDVAGALPAFALRRLFHASAAALAVGAVAGMFVRGVFFDYAMVWRSTFIRDPESAAQALRVVLGPAALALGWPLPDAADATRMMEPWAFPPRRGSGSGR